MEHITDSSGNTSVQIVAPVVDLIGDASEPSDGHLSQTSPPVVSVRSSSPVEPGTPAQSIAPDVDSVHSSHLSSAKPQSTSPSDDEETAKARMDAALAAQEAANQKLAYIRAKKKSSRASRASSVAAALSPPPGLQGQPAAALQPQEPQQTMNNPDPGHRAPVGDSRNVAPQISDPMLPTASTTRNGPLQLLTSMLGGARRGVEQISSRLNDPVVQDWREMQPDDPRQPEIVVDLSQISDRLKSLEYKQYKSTHATTTRGAPASSTQPLVMKPHRRWLGD